MKIAFETQASAADTLIFLCDKNCILSDLSSKQASALPPLLKAEKFEGKKGQTLVVPGQPRLVVFGIENPQKLESKDWEDLGSRMFNTLKAWKAEKATVMLGQKFDAQAAVSFGLGTLLQSYRFGKYFTKDKKDKLSALKSLTFVLSEAAAAKKGFAVQEKVVEGVFLTRDLVSEAPNVLYPLSFAEIIRKELTPLGVKVSVLHRKDILKKGMGALAAVGQGSAREECLVTMEYMGAGKKDASTAFVGKGVTFDTGGISIKPAAGMDEMKWDMAGAGAVVGLMKALALRKAKANVVGVVVLAENMPSGNAARPGDIVTSLSGQTIEILNTDAEGRLILCDALWYCQETFRPTRIVDLATLTGAMIVALGHEYAGVFSNDEDLAKSLIAAGQTTQELLWRMPLNEAWDKALDSPVADIKNIAAPNVGAGSAIGAHFLKRFIQKDVAWAHLDIAGMAWTGQDKPTVPKGAVGFGVRLLDRFVADVCEK